MRARQRYSGEKDMTDVMTVESWDSWKKQDKEDFLNLFHNLVGDQCIGSAIGLPPKSVFEADEAAEAKRISKTLLDSRMRDHFIEGFTGNRLLWRDTHYRDFAWYFRCILKSKGYSAAIKAYNKEVPQDGQSSR
jgi:hypothetical protein